MKFLQILSCLFLAESCFAQGFQPDNWLRKPSIKSEAITEIFNSLKKTTSDSSHILTSRSTDGKTLFFLRRSSIKGVTKVEEIASISLKSDSDDDSTKISFISDGLLQGLATGQGPVSIPANLSLGVTIRRFYPKTKLFRALYGSIAFSVASNVGSLSAVYDEPGLKKAPTNLRDFSSSILLPINGPIQGQGLFVNTRLILNRDLIRPPTIFKKRIFNTLENELALRKVDTINKEVETEISNMRNKGILGYAQKEDADGDTNTVQRERKRLWGIKTYDFECPNDLFVPSLDIQMAVSNREWNIRSSDLSDSLAPRSLGLFYLRVGPSVEILDFERVKNDFSIRFGIYYSMRALFGDLGQTESESARTALLKTTSRIFHGFEPGIEVIIKNLRISASCPFLWATDGADVSGLTGGRFVISAGITIGTPPIRL